MAGKIAILRSAKITSHFDLGLLGLLIVGPPQIGAQLAFRRPRSGPKFTAFKMEVIFADLTLAFC